MNPETKFPEYSPHPFSKIVPEIDAAAFDKLTADIKKNGSCEPIVLYDEQILEGRPRYEICKNVNVEPKFVQFTTIYPPVNDAKDQTQKDAIARKWVVSHYIQ
jgi:hypothetical protein